MPKFYLCKICGNLVEKIEDGGNSPFCCGRQMTELLPASTDGAVEKHVPVLHYQDLADAGVKITASVGSTPHPSESYHHINWIALETDKGMQLKKLSPGDTPEADFLIARDEKVIAAYAYCNLHGLWKG